MPSSLLAKPTPQKKTVSCPSVHLLPLGHGLLHPEKCNLEFSSATCCMGFFLSGGLTAKIAFRSLRSAQRPARAVHGEVQVLKARRPCSIHSLQGPCLTQGQRGLLEPQSPKNVLKHQFQSSEKTTSR